VAGQSPHNSFSVVVQRSACVLFILLFLYNSAGYTLVFTTLQYHARNEIKRMIRQRVPEEQLEVFAISRAEERMPDGPFQRVHEREFWYHGHLYDIVRSEQQNDTTIYYCINDIVEQKLFAQLDDHVRAHMGTEVPWEKGPAASALLSIIKDAITSEYRIQKLFPQYRIFISGPVRLPVSFHPDRITPPPEVYFA
jgi:hypothetical protein